MMDDEINYISEKLQATLTTLELSCIFCEKPHDFEIQREIINEKKK